MVKKEKESMYKICVVLAIVVIILSGLLTAGCTEWEGRQLEKGKIEVEFREIEWLFSLNRSKYEDHFEEGPINGTLREAFDNKSYPVDKNATVSKPYDDFEGAEWLIYENGKIRYVVVYLAVKDRDIAIYRPVTKDRVKEVIHTFNCTTAAFFSPENSTSSGWEAYVNVPEGEERKYVSMFENHTAVLRAYLEWNYP